MLYKQRSNPAIPFSWRDVKDSNFDGPRLKPYAAAMPPALLPIQTFFCTVVLVLELVTAKNLESDRGTGLALQVGETTQVLDQVIKKEAGDVLQRISSGAESALQKIQQIEENVADGIGGFASGFKEQGARVADEIDDLTDKILRESVEKVPSTPARMPLALFGTCKLSLASINMVNMWDASLSHDSRGNHPNCLPASNPQICHSIHPSVHPSVHPSIRPS